MKLIRTLILSFILFGISCANSIDVEDSKVFGIEALSFCINEVKKITGKDLSPEINMAYIDVFPDGYTVGFTRGSVGTFGKRSRNYSMILACGVSTRDGMKLAVLRPQGEDLFNDKNNLPPYENFKEEVIEIMFRRDGKEFKYCCSQNFDEKNIKKNNPDFPWKKDKVS